jgi:hypothetical protein
MIWPTKDKETIIKTCFALFPKKIGDYWVWLSHYYKTWDCMWRGGWLYYTPIWFIEKEDAEAYVRAKQNM